MSVVVECVCRRVAVVFIVMAVSQVIILQVFVENYHCKNNSVAIHRATEILGED